MDAIAAVYELSESAVYVHCELILLLLHPFNDFFPGQPG